MGCASSQTAAETQVRSQPRQAAPYPTANPPSQQTTAQPQQSTQPEEKSDIKVQKIKLDKKVLEKYLELSKQSHALEARNVIKTLEAKKEEAKDLETTVQQLEQHYKDCVKSTEKEKADVDQMQNPTVKNFFKQQSEYDAKLSKEQEEYLEALNKQEIAEKDLEGVKRQKQQVENEAKGLETDAKALQKIYDEQDVLLASIFDGKYGSELEFKLESDLEMALDRKQRISVAKYKWQNARLLLQHAVNQLAVAVKKWVEVGKLPADNVQARYTCATETRNNVIAASQNITSAQRYLQTIQFPYCKPPEVVTLNRAVNNIYSDMTSNERHMHAMQCYSTTHKRSAALLQWFDHVIQNTITKDFTTSTMDCDFKEKLLRKERLRLIKQRIQQSGNDIHMDIDAASELGPSVGDELVETNATEADKVSNAGDLPAGEMTNQETGETIAEDSTTPLPLSELAPAPKNDELFGDIDQLKKQHQQEMDEFNKAQEVNKARMEQGLQEKLRERQSRRKRQEATQA